MSLYSVDCCLPQSCRLLKSSTKLYSFFQSASFDRFDIFFTLIYYYYYYYLLYVRNSYSTYQQSISYVGVACWFRQPVWISEQLQNTLVILLVPVRFHWIPHVILIHDSVESFQYIWLTRTTTSSQVSLFLNVNIVNRWTHTRGRTIWHMLPTQECDRTYCSKNTTV